MTEEDFIEECFAAPRPLTEAAIKWLVKLFYALPDNGAGGKLHVVLDDNNWEREHVQWCRDRATEADDKAAVRMAKVLLELTDDQLRAWLGPGNCGHCSAEYGDEHVGHAFDTPDGRCPECGSWPETVT